MRSTLTHLTMALIIGGSFVFSPYAFAENSVAERLDKAGVKHEVDKDGDYKVAFSYTDDKRSQLVYVSGKTETAHGLVIREIFAPAAIVATDKIDGTKALELLNDNATKKLGAWEIRGGTVIYNVKVSDDVDAKTLAAILENVAQVADDMELKLTGKDDL